MASHEVAGAWGAVFGVMGSSADGVKVRALHELSAISVAPDRELTEGKQGRPSLSPTSTSHPARHLGRCLPPSLSNICEGTAGMQKELAKPGLSVAMSMGHV